MRASEEQAFAAFVREHGDGLLRFARWLIPDSGEAEDALQTALLRLTSRWPKEKPEAYVRATLVNLTRDRARRRHLVAVPTSAKPPDSLMQHDADEAADAQHRLEQVLALLPPRQRTTVVLRVLEGLSEAETATIMGCSTGTAKSNLARGLDKARAALSNTDLNIKESL